MSDEMTIPCPSCGAPMVERINSINLSSFLGCSRYPECRETRKVPAAVEMRRAGGIELPGLETS